MWTRNILTLLAVIQCGVCVAIGMWSRGDKSGVGSIEDLTIEPAQIMLGQMEPGERRTAYAKLINTSANTVYLNEPRTTCGCVQVTLDEQVVGPFQHAALRFTAAAGRSPEDFLQNVFLSSVERPAALREITLKGTVAPAFWTHPEALGGELDEEGNLALDFCILTSAEGEITSVSTASTEMRIETRERLPAAYHARLYVSSTHSGSASLEVVGRTERVAKCTVNVPVYWWRRPNVFVMPSSIVISSTDKRKLVTPLFIYGEPAFLDAGVLIDSLYPWVTVLSRTRLNDRTSKLALGVDQDSAPKDLKSGTPVLALRPKGIETYERVPVFVSK